VASKNGLHVFLRKPWAPFLKSSNVGRHFYPDFTFGGAPATTLLFITASQVISWFIQIDLKKNLLQQLGTEKIPNDFL